MQEGVFLAADIDEDRAQPGDDAFDAPLVDVADLGTGVQILDKKFNQRAVFQHGHPNVGGLHINQDLSAHGWASMLLGRKGVRRVGGGDGEGAKRRETDSGGSVGHKRARMLAARCGEVTAKAAASDAVQQPVLGLTFEHSVPIKPVRMGSRPKRGRRPGAPPKIGGAAGRGEPVRNGPPLFGWLTRALAKGSPGVQ
ncbi:MAG TPA: hypothetical protein PLG73_06260 [Candidatus Sumerlaeota bacterium]|nr:hypothetical protein [Candidatus Sumerlaeota bacterium]